MHTEKCDFLVVDGRHLLYRASDSHRGLEVKNEDGESFATGGIYGFLNVLMRVHYKYGGKVAVVWEGDRKNFRVDLLPSYKKRDQPMDPEKLEFIQEMSLQERTLQTLLSKAGVRQYAGVGCEADDVIGRLAVHVSDESRKRVYIYSGDSDLRQLIRQNEDGSGVWTVSPGMQHGGDKIYDFAAVVEKHNVQPDQIPQLKALSGDHSDNVPGIKGIGPKTAAQLIETYDTIENVIKGANDSAEHWPVAARFQAPVAASADLLRLYLRLTTIDLKCQMSTIAPARRQAEVVAELTRLKFRSLAGPVELRQLMGLGK